MYRNQSPIKIVTASDASHEASLFQLLSSIQRLRWPTEVVVYDLGLSDQCSANILSNFSKVQVKMFDFAQYPFHYSMDRNSGSYAWKPSIIRFELGRMQAGTLLWLDAGCILHKWSWFLPRIISKYGLFGNPSTSTTNSMCHPSTLKTYFSRNPHLFDQYSLVKDEPMISAAHLGFLVSDMNKQLADRWEEMALDWELISPLGSTKSNHRFDQALLTLLLRLETTAVPIFQFWRRWLPRAFTGISTHKDID